MTRLDRHVLVVVGLVTLTALAIWLPRSQAHVHSAPPMMNVPATLGSWIAKPTNPDYVLPIDRRSTETLVRSYESGSRHVWLGVSRYTGENGPDKRPDIDVLISDKGVTGLDRARVNLVAGDRPPVPATRLTVLTRGRKVNIWYWYRLGARDIGDEYSLRFWMGTNSVMHRLQPLLLVRIATMENDLPVDFIEPLDRQLGALSEERK